MPNNLYVHFPFCRVKCAYCALFSRPGASEDARNVYTDRIRGEIAALTQQPLSTIYFGGGSPALCELSRLRDVLTPLIDAGTEFTVEMHPKDVTDAKLEELKAIGVNRISMGLQSLDDQTLIAMNRGYTLDEAHQAFDRAKRVFDNVGIDLIVGFPGDPCKGYERLSDWGLVHCSAYSLQNERNLKNVPDDEWTLDHLKAVGEALKACGLIRYEISNYALPGRECRHNLATWRGEDYRGIGEGAYGREGLKRTRGLKDFKYETESVTADSDHKERTLFRLRTIDGLDTAADPEWRTALDEFVDHGLLTREGTIYRLTSRGTEVCDSILAELI